MGLKSRGRMSYELGRWVIRPHLVASGLRDILKGGADFPITSG